MNSIVDDAHCGKKDTGSDIRRYNLHYETKRVNLLTQEENIANQYAKLQIKRQQNY